MWKAYVPYITLSSSIPAYIARELTTKDKTRKHLILKC